MKSFLCLLAAVAVAYGDAEAQYLGYNGLYNNYAGVYSNGLYNNYAYARPVVSSYSSLYPSSVYSGVRVLGKREAEAEPEAQIYAAGINAYPAAYSNIYNNYAYNSLYRPAVAYSRIAAPSVYSGVRVLGKREAEAEPEAQIYGYGLNAYNTAAYAAAPVSAYAAAPAYTSYAARPYMTYNNWNAGLYSGVRVLGKREAEAEPQYLLRSPYTTAAAYPYAAYPYSAYNAYRTYSGYPYVY